MFTWNAYEAPRVDLDFICHHLNVNLTVLPKKKSPWRSSKEHSVPVKEEVNKLSKLRLLRKFSTLNGWPIL